jgi:hypothetical protein
MAGQVILRIAYGIDVQQQNDPFVALAEQALHSVTLASSLGGGIFDMVPFRAYLSFPSSCTNESLGRQSSTYHGGSPALASRRRRKSGGRSCRT